MKGIVLSCILSLTLWTEVMDQRHSDSSNDSRFLEYNITDYLVPIVPVDIRGRATVALMMEYAQKNGEKRFEENEIVCPPPLTVSSCPPNKYRTANGSCNNVRHPEWGARGSPFLRLIPPDYNQGATLTEKMKNLPSSSEIWHKIIGSKVNIHLHEHVTVLLGAWGKMLHDDLAHTINADNLKCCKHKHPECAILIDKGVCHDYMRSVPTVDENCKYAYREQMNIATSFLDGSALYGHTDKDMKSLRTFEGGQVNLKACRKCTQTAQGSLYTVLLREHNQLARQLSELNSLWDDETLFQEARRILVAEIQHITYNEFLPLVVGKIIAQQPQLKLKEQGFYTGYSSSNHAGIFNSVATSVLQMFSSLIPPELNSGIAANGTSHFETFNNILIAMLQQPASKPSLYIEKMNNGWEDKGSFLIHMGRDHNLSGYTRFLQHCVPSISNLANNFTDLTQIMSVQDVNLLKKIYKDINKVDFIIGGTLETEAFGAMLGPTFVCILAHQFVKIRNSDRFWYENDIPPSSFSKDQLKELRKVSLAGMLCDNTPGLDDIQSQAFVLEDPYLNVRIACSLQPSLDLSPWRDTELSMKISDEMLMQAVEKAEADLKLRREQEYLFWTKNGGVDPKSPVGIAAAFSKANKQALALANTSILLEYASEELMNSLHSDHYRKKRQVFDSIRDNFINFGTETIGDDLSNGLQNVDIGAIVPLGVDSPDCDSVEERSPCNIHSQYRTFTGYCNNLMRPKLGKSLSTFARLMPPVYENGVSHPRLNSILGSPLPSPRLISTMIHADISNLHNRYSLMLMQFAQFTDHDLTFTPVHKGFFSSIPDCRSCNSPRTVHPECMPIPVPVGDHYYPQFNHTTGERLCLPFMRSLPGQLTLGAREQINQNSAFLDGSQIYGEHSCLARELRALYGGHLNVTKHPFQGKDLLPQSPNHPECRAPSGYCLIAGDGRASEQPALTSIHTIFMREHNRIVDALFNINPHWDDEHLYQTGRRVLIGALQHITYNEFLPRVLGWTAINLYELKLRPQGFYKGYSSNCNPSIVNEFAAAAFRIGHSLLRPHIPRMSVKYQVVDPPILLRNGFFNPDMVYQANMIDEIIRGLVSTPMENLDQFITGEITNHLFEDRGIPHSGVDLIALNIQRARDHAIRPYNDYRALCNLKRAATFDDLSREIPPEVIARLKRLYASVDDIDLFPGGMSERPVQGGLVGPTFACIIALQFRQLRKCDRFWYETDDSKIRFTESQLAEIRKVTLAKILCDNMDIPSDIQRATLDQPSSFLNPRVPCHTLPQIDFNAWRESPQGCQIGGQSIAIGGSAFPSPCSSCVCTSEGAQCASLKITDCPRLLREASREAILRDEVCTAQCGFLLQQDIQTAATRNPDPVLDIVFTTTNSPSAILLNKKPQHPRSLIATGLVPPPPRLRTSQIRRRQPFPPAFGEFGLPDLSRHVG